MTIPLGPNELLARLQQFSQAPLGCYPTPLERWERLERCLDRRGRLYAKREDLTGFAFGGNKVRQLEFLLGDALEKGSDVIVHGGAVQSNYCRVLAAAANKLGLDCHLVLSRAYGQPEDQGNLLLDRIAGASIELVHEPLGAGQEDMKSKAVQRLAALGRKPYLISYPDSEILGTLAYVKVAVEIYQQCKQLSWDPKHVVVAAVGSTQSGLLLGLRLLGWHGHVVGFSPLCHGEYAIKETLWRSIQVAARMLGAESPVAPSEVLSETEFAGEGYARTTRVALDAIKMVARTEGVFLDPIYTGKAMAGLLDYFRREKISAQEDVLFVHTGGNTALFAYNREILESCDIDICVRI
jgi:D-cysteine desulfhydrase family pyridoxal phosphate-dependent enzyme